MALIDQSTITLTKSMRANRRMKETAFRQYKAAVRAYEDALHSFWKDEALTPQQMADALGTEASQYFQFYGALRTFILDVNPNQELTPVSSYGTFTVNQDGTVTIDSVV